jgi:superfamily II DNA or RNA helicase
VKLATGSGKTLVMAMTIAWSVLNKAANAQDVRFADAILVVCPTSPSRNGWPASIRTARRTSTGRSG